MLACKMGICMPRDAKVFTPAFMIGENLCPFLQASGPVMIKGKVWKLQLPITLHAKAHLPITIQLGLRLSRPPVTAVTKTQEIPQ